MYPLHDKDLDRLSRNAAEHYEMDFGPSGWEQLERRLDQELPQKKDRRRFLFWLFFIVVTTGSALIGLLISSKPVTPLASRSIKSAPANDVSANSTPTDQPTFNNNSVDPGTLSVPDATIQKSSKDAPRSVQPGTSSATTSTIKNSSKDAPRNVQPGTSSSNGVTKPATIKNGTNDVPRKVQSEPSYNNNVAPTLATNDNSAKKKSLNNTKRGPISNPLPFGLNNIPQNFNSSKDNKHRRQPANNDKNDDLAAATDIKTTDQDITSAQPIREAAATDNKETANVQPSNEAAANNKKQIPGAHPVNKAAAADNTKPTVDTQPSNEAASDNKKTPGAQPSNDAATAVTDPHKTTTDSTNTPIAKKEPKKTNTPNRGLELGIVAGPDASMVEFGPLYKAGYNAGLQVGYRFNDRWSVNTGIIYTRKFYKADSTTFHAPKRSYVSYVKLDVLQGYCAMLDIPLNVRYDFAFNKKQRFFANTGLSTYLMDEQNYDYYYWQTWGMNTYRDSSWASGDNHNYLFSVLNLTIGYERMLGKRFSLQAEPYLKIPLKGMGFGNMKMDSYGIYFSLKYRPQFGSKRNANKK